uniref:Xpo1 domain-containing protein n=1 Tax=Dracunculus medinensis TaxID=318479 RepID=A0A0N4U6I4_DRAME
LLDSKFPPIVQHYGACVLYETINDSWEYCSSKQEIVQRLKNILIEKLTMGAHMQNQSITNKLSSSLASFILYCIPDIWPDPFGDIATLWSGQPELLLRVLTEIAAEFHRVRLPLRQRGVVKSILKQTIPNLIKIIEIVLNGENIPPSLKNAAVECAEQWLKLPGNDLAEWHSHLHLILLNIADDWYCLFFRSLFCFYFLQDFLIT